MEKSVLHVEIGSDGISAGFCGDIRSLLAMCQLALEENCQKVGVKFNSAAAEMLRVHNTIGTVREILKEGAAKEKAGDED